MIAINVTKAKAITHDARRAARAQEFAPLDIKATIPSEAEAAEAARQAVRVRYAEMQVAVDTATDVVVLKSIMAELNT